MEYYEFLKNNGYEQDNSKKNVTKLREKYFYSHLLPQSGISDIKEQQRLAQAAAKEFDRQEKLYDRHMNNMFKQYKKEIINNDNINTAADLISKKMQQAPDFFKDTGEPINFYEQEKKYQQQEEERKQKQTVADAIASPYYYKQLEKEYKNNPSVNTDIKLGDYIGPIGKGLDAANQLVWDGYNYLNSKIKAREQQAKEWSEFMGTDTLNYDDFYDVFALQAIKNSPTVKTIRSLISPTKLKDTPIYKSNAFVGDLLGSAAGLVTDLPLFALGPATGMALSKGLGSFADEYEKYKTTGEFNPLDVGVSVAKGATLGGVLDIVTKGGSKLFSVSANKIINKLTEKGVSNAQNIIAPLMKGLENTTMPFFEAGALLAGEQILDPSSAFEPISSRDFANALAVSAGFRALGYVKQKRKGVNSIQEYNMNQALTEFSAFSKIRDIIKSKSKEDITLARVKKEIRKLDNENLLDSVSETTGMTKEEIRNIDSLDKAKEFSKKYDNFHEDGIVDTIAENIKDSYDPTLAIKNLAEQIGIPYFNEGGEVVSNSASMAKKKAEVLLDKTTTGSIQAKDLKRFLIGDYDAAKIFKTKGNNVYDHSANPYELDLYTGKRSKKRESRLPFTDTDAAILKNALELKRSIFKNAFENKERVVSAMGAGLNEIIINPMNKGESTSKQIKQRMTEEYKNKKQEFVLKYKDYTTRDLEDIGAFMLSKDPKSRKLLEWNKVNVPDSLTPKQQDLMDYYDSILKKRHIEINEARALAGKDPIGFIDYYLPVVTKKSFKQDWGLKQFKNEMEIKDQDYVSKNMRDYAFERGRGGNYAPIEINAEKLFKHYIDKSTDSMIKTPIVSKLRMMIKDKTLDDGSYFSLKDKKPNTYRMLDRLIDSYEGIPIQGYDNTLGAWRFLDKISSNVGKAYISFNANTVITQLAAIHGAAAEAPQYLLKHSDSIFSPRKWREAMANSSELQTRIADQILNEFGTGTTKRGKLKEALFGDTSGRIDRKYLNKYTEALAKGTEALNTLGIKPMVYTDLAAAMTSWHVAKEIGMKRYGLKDGSRQLRDFADKKVRDWNASGKSFDQIDVMRHPAGKAWLKFMTFPINQYNYIMRDRFGINPFKKDPGSNIQDPEFTFKKGKISRTAGILNYMLMGGIISAGYKSLGLFSPIPDPLTPLADAIINPKNEKDAFYKAMYESFQEMLGGLPLGSSFKWGRSGLSGAVFDVPMQIVDSFSNKHDSKPLIEPLVAIMGLAPAKQFIKYYRREQKRLKDIDKKQRKDARLKKKQDREQDPMYQYRKFKREMRKYMYGNDPKKRIEREVNKGMLDTLMDYRPNR